MKEHGRVQFLNVGYRWSRMFSRLGSFTAGTYEPKSLSEPCGLDRNDKIIEGLT